MLHTVGRRAIQPLRYKKYIIAPSPTAAPISVPVLEHTTYARRRLVRKSSLRLPITTDGELTVCTSYIPSPIPLRRRPKTPCELITFAAKESLNLPCTPLAVDDTILPSRQPPSTATYNTSLDQQSRWRPSPRSTIHCLLPYTPARLHYFLLTYPRASTIFSTGLQYFLLVYHIFYWPTIFSTGLPPLLRYFVQC